MTTIKSDKNLPNLGVTETKMSFDLDEMISRFGKERAELVVARLVCAYQFGSGLKAAFEGSAKRESVVAKHKGWVEAVKAGETLNGLDFIATEKEEKLDGNQEKIREKWNTASEEKRAAFLSDLGLSKKLASASAEEVEEAYLERKAQIKNADLD